jgi:N-acetyl-gamma-glutamyl-phosphate reductase
MYKNTIQLKCEEDFEVSEGQEMSRTQGAAFLRAALTQQSGVGAKPIRVGIVGVTGYAGMEALRYLLYHPHVTVTYVAGREERSEAPLGEIIPQFTGLTPLSLVPFDEVTCSEQCDAVLIALPHGSSGEVAARLFARDKRVVDLSGDLRLPGELYQTWYQRSAQPDDVIAQAVYGLSEWNRAEIATAGLIANPGCYATAVLLALKPLMASGLLAKHVPIVVDAKSGVSGAGKSSQSNTQFAELAENFYAYKPGVHQHAPEIEYTLDPTMETRLLFTPHLLPISRGIFASCYVPLSAAQAVTIQEIYSLYQNCYQNSPFIQILEQGIIPQTKWVRGTNKCQISLRLDERTGLLQVFSVIDNLGKGAAGQAVQNLNIMYGFPETTGLLPSVAWTP